MVQLPETVSLLHGAFRCCRALRVVIAPGCQHFGPKVFEECCSLTQIGVTQCPDNILAPQAQLRPGVFQGRTALQHLNLGKKGQDSANPNRSLPDCCFLEAGIVALYLPSDFNRVGAAACVSCQQLRTVDLSQTKVIEILGSTFAHCSQLQQLSLSRNLRIIEQEAFSSAPSCKKSASHHPCFTLLGVLLQAVRSFEHFVNKEKAKHGEVQMPGSMPLTNASNWTSPNGSDSYRQMPMTNGETTSKQPHTKLAKQMTVGMDCYSAVNFVSQVQESSG